MNDYTEEQYPFLVNEIMKHIEEVKKDDQDIALIDIIFDYAFRNGIDVELVGDAISTDVYFKSFIEKDCELHRIFKTNNNQMQDW
jgi:hypothetical protein